MADTNFMVMIENVVSFTRNPKNDGAKKVRVSFRVTKVIDQAIRADIASGKSPFTAVSDAYETAAKLMFLFGTRNFSSVKAWVEAQK